MLNFLFLLLEKDKLVTIHTRNVQNLAPEIFKVKTSISAAAMTEIFTFCDNPTRNLRSGQVLEHRNNRTNNFGVESISTLGTKICVLGPENLRQSTSLNSFKQGIKNGTQVTQVTVLNDYIGLTYKIWVSFN